MPREFIKKERTFQNRILFCWTLIDFVEISCYEKLIWHLNTHKHIYFTWYQSSSFVAHISPRHFLRFSSLRGHGRPPSLGSAKIWRVFVIQPRPQAVEQSDQLLHSLTYIRSFKQTIINSKLRVYHTAIEALSIAMTIKSMQKKISNWRKRKECTLFRLISYSI